MKFFRWFNGGQDTKRKPVTVETTNHRNQESCKEEFKDWPNSFLAIGTFGNTSTTNDHKDQKSSPDLAEFTAEEIVKLQKELKTLLSRKPANNYKSEGEIYNNNNVDLPLDKFLNCPSSLEVDRRISSRFSTNSDNNYVYDEEEEIIDRTIRVIIGRCKDVCMNKENKKKTIGKKSISFLVKKMFTSSAPMPSLRDTLQESRMDKLLRTLLSKKINSQKASRKKTYLEGRHTQREEDDQEEKKGEKSSDDGSKWVKTDSEYIVLEI